MNTLYLCGAGNPEGVRLARKINRARCRWDRIVVLDDDPSKLGQNELARQTRAEVAVAQRA